MKKIICIHLLNDYSGSPLVLSTVIKNLVQEGRDVEVITCAGNEGFLSGLQGVRYRFFTYRFFSHKLMRLMMLLWSQLALFLKILQYRRTDAVIYVNTLLPFGAALAGKLTGKKVVYHLHETTVNPPVLKTFLKKVATLCATEAIYVSQFLMQAEPLVGVPSRVIYNCLSKDFIEKAQSHLAENTVKNDQFTVLMLCSLKEYKGVNEYMKLAITLPEYRFLLVLNATPASLEKYFDGMSLPDNLTIFPAQKEVHSFYRQAHLVLNLSHPEKWVETFGMTLLEAMHYGLPVIAPPVGGPEELVENGFNGFKIDQRHFQELQIGIQTLAQREGMYQRLSQNALDFTKRFSEQLLCRQVLEVVK